LHVVDDQRHPVWIADFFEALRNVEALDTSLEPTVSVFGWTIIGVADVPQSFMSRTGSAVGVDLGNAQALILSRDGHRSAVHEETHVVAVSRTLVTRGGDIGRS
jgi:hypothetical protein